MKKILCAVSFLLLFFVFDLSAQQITKFAVIDTATVYEVYFRESSAIKNYEAKKTEFQAEVDRLTDELKDLQLKKVEAQKSGDSVAALRYDSEITTKASYITEYTRAKNIELDDIKKRLQTSDDFYTTLYSVIARIAESEGYSMVLSLRQADSVLWYSPSVDITDKVIESLASER